MKTSELQGAALDWAVAKCEGNYGHFGVDGYTPSTDWAQGGPIIERERIQLCPSKNGWCAATHTYIEGPTALIAAMRCYVVSKLGDEIEIPMELI